MRCKTCHYSLEGLTGPPHRCPECGREFDPDDHCDPVESGQPGTLPIRDVVIVAIVAFGVSFAGFLWDSRFHPDIPTLARLKNAAFDAVKFLPFAFAIIFVLYLLLWRVPSALLRRRHGKR